ncbi:MAG: hypothetical protein FD160_3880, partial [Caulobacteraceae bacterium]
RVAVVLGLAACGSACEDACAPTTEPPEPGPAAVLHGSGWTQDGSDPRLPWVAAERRARVAPDDHTFHLLLASDVIVDAHGLAVGWSQFHEPGRTGGSPELEDRAHRSVSAVVDRVLRGDVPGPTIRLDVYCAPAEDGDHVPCSALRRLVATPDERATLFLQLANDEILYFAGHTPAALQSRIDSEIVEQVRTLGRNASVRLDRAPHPLIEARADAEIARMTRSPLDQYDAMRALIALGVEAVPAIVRHMNDVSAARSGVAGRPIRSQRRAHGGLNDLVEAVVGVAAERQDRGRVLRGAGLRAVDAAVVVEQARA